MVTILMAHEPATPNLAPLSPDTQVASMLCVVSLEPPARGTAVIDASMDRPFESM